MDTHSDVLSYTYSVNASDRILNDYYCLLRSMGWRAMDSDGIVGRMSAMLQVLGSVTGRWESTRSID